MHMLQKHPRSYFCSYVFTLAHALSMERIGDPLSLSMTCANIAYVPKENAAAVWRSQSPHCAGIEVT